MKLFLEDLLEFPLRADEFFKLSKSFPFDENRKVLYKNYFENIFQKSSSISNEKQQRQKSSLYFKFFFFS